ncbi:unnamed protein product [Schistosoma margrebowiei]|uniref:Uncharacterized protein n=1 Tax=Schistosoma margrebowiei TaxID=48269 RepID=A0AA84Z7D8_9TREM|nr:unnamed protein product [Schistosoma margrebowiei]
MAAFTMLDGVNNVVAELYSYFTDVQISFIKYAITALLVTSTSFYLLRRSLGKEPVLINTKKSKTRVKKSKTKSSDSRTSSSDGDHAEIRKHVITPRNTSIVNTQKSRIPVSTTVEVSPMFQNLAKDDPGNDDKSDDWVTIKKGKKISDQRPKYKETIKEPKTIISEVITSRGENGGKHQFASAENGVDPVPLKTSKKLPPVPQIPTYKSAVFEPDGDWHEVRPSRKGRKTVKQ